MSLRRPSHVQGRVDSVNWTDAEIARLENSIQHLEASNVELRVWAGIECSAGKPEDGTTTTAAVDDDEEQLDEDSKREFAEAVRENEETMCVVGVVSLSGKVTREADPFRPPPLGLCGAAPVNANA